MKDCSSELAAFLDAKIAANVRIVRRAHAYTFSLLGGAVLRYTDADFPFVHGGNTFLASGPIVKGLVYKSTVGLDVDQQEITITAGENVLLNGGPFMRAIAEGAFEYARIKRERVYFDDDDAWTVVGGLTLFDGRILEVKDCGRFSADISVADDRVLLANQMPRNTYSATCNHALYGAGCGLDAEDFATSATIGAGSTDRTIKIASAAVGHIGGYIAITSGALNGARATVKDVDPGVAVILAYPFDAAPASGVTCKIYQGCDHTGATCKAKFDNLANFRGFPFVPPPQFAQ